MTTVQQVFNDLLAWVEQKANPSHVIAFQHVTIAGNLPIGYAYGTFDSGAPISTAGAFLAGSYEQAVSNLHYSVVTGHWEKSEGPEIMTDSGKVNVRLQLATDHLLFTLSDGAQWLLNSVDLRHSVLIGESPSTKQLFVLSYSKTIAPLKS